ncbi:hypothetical protein LSPH24S_02782 [Lysinibacillus sphaericus]
MQVHKFWISLAEVCRAIPNKDGFDRYSADYHFIGAIQGTDDLDWIQVGEHLLDLQISDFPSPMIPSTFSQPIVELAVRITMPHMEM